MLNAEGAPWKLLRKDLVKASFMMMNQVDSSSFDDEKDDDKKPKE